MDEACEAAVAQPGERGAVDPEVPGSNPGGGPILIPVLFDIREEKKVCTAITMLLAWLVLICWGVYIMYISLYSRITLIIYATSA